jgi:hypothetical protein
VGWRFELRNAEGADVGALWLGEGDRVYAYKAMRWRMVQAVAWCRDCQAYVAAERVPTMQRIDEMLAVAGAGLQPFLRKLAELGAPLPEGDEAELEARREFDLKRWREVKDWRARRKSPLSHCLECFSTAVALVPEYASETVHPLTGERLWFEVSGPVDVGRHRKYTVEGLPVENFTNSAVAAKLRRRHEAKLREILERREAAGQPGDAGQGSDPGTVSIAGPDGTAGAPG